VEPLSRPVPPRSLSERTTAWVSWFGVGRLVGASVATVVVCLGAYWLVRMPPPATEASLPRVTAATPDSSVPATSGASAAATVAVEAAADTPADTSVVVHVAGAVEQPGVYELTVGARVRDAVVAAGGPTPEADWDALNLAAVVADASRVYVPAIGEDVVATVVPSPVGDPAPPGLVDVNHADAALLETLPGVGPATAAAIITERERNGPFLGVDDLDRVPGIGPAKLAAIRDLVVT
jgi:competence protein ComEA